MKLYIYRGLDGEKVPMDVTHVIVDDSVTVINEMAFFFCIHLVSVIMGDNVKRIAEGAFIDCAALRFIRLSKTLENIGPTAFCLCGSLEALFLPSTVTSIGHQAFQYCKLKILVLPNSIDLSNFAESIQYTEILKIAEASGMEYEYDWNDRVTVQSRDQVHNWLIHHMDEFAFHKVCCNPSITTRQMNDYLNEHGKGLADTIDTIHGMTPLQLLSMNPHASAETIAALLDANVEAVFHFDNQGKTSLDNARDYNVGGMIHMINGLCNHRHANNNATDKIDPCSLSARIFRARRFGRLSPCLKIFEFRGAILAILIAIYHVTASKED